MPGPRLPSSAETTTRATAGRTRPVDNLNHALHGPAFGSYTFTGGSGDAITISLNTGCAGGGSCIGLVDQASASLETVTAIAEPATLSVLGTGLFALGTGLRRKFVKA